MRNLTYIHSPTVEFVAFAHSESKDFSPVFILETQPQKDWFASLLLDFFKENKKDAEIYSKNLKENLLRIS